MARTYIHRQSGTIPGILINDGAISARAKGIYAFIQSRPDGWDFSAEKIAEKMKEGRDAIRIALRELESAKYLIRKRFQTDKGFWDIEYHLFESPTDLEEEKPETEIQSQEIQSTDNQAIIYNTTVSSILNHSIINNNTEEIPKKQKIGMDEIKGFFSDAEKDPDAALLSIGMPVEFLEKFRGVFDDFTSYWTEPTLTGGKVKWQTEKTFEPKRRFRTWCKNRIQWSQEKKTQSSSRISEVRIPTL